MAKYTINYTCGHSETEQLYGPNKERERKIDWKERGVCPDCYRKEQSEKAEASANAAGLPALSGSDKQIAWAQTIRAGHAALIDKWIAKIDSATAVWGGDQAQGLDLHDLAVAIAQQIKAEVLVQSEARYWIDHRDAYSFECKILSEPFRARMETSPLYRSSKLAQAEKKHDVHLVGGA